MPAVQLKALMNTVCKIVDNACTFLPGDRLNLLRDGCLQCSNGARVTKVDVVLEEHPKEEIWRIQVRGGKRPFHFSHATDEMLTKFLTEPCYGSNSNVRKSTIPLEPLLLLSKVLTLFELSPELLKNRNVTFFCHCLCYPKIFKEK